MKPCTGCFWPYHWSMDPERRPFGSILFGYGRQTSFDPFGRQPQIRFIHICLFWTSQMPYVLFYSLFMICAGLTLPRTSGLFTRPQIDVNFDCLIITDYSLFYYFMFWLTFLSISLIFIFINGIEYVSWPRLIPPTDTVYYNGPGFRSAHNGKGFRLSSRTRKLVGRRRAGSIMQQIELGAKKRVDWGMD